MKKILALTLAMVVVLAPMSFAANAVCDAVGSPQYLKSTGAKFVRGLGNVAFSWVELFRQPMIRENKWEGVGRGLAHTVGRAVSGALEAVTCFIPAIEIPQMDPACPVDLLQASK